MEKEASEQLLPLFAKAYPERNPVDMLKLDFLFRYPTQQYIRRRSALNECTFSYLFNLDMPVDGGRTPWHCADIPYVFHNTELVPVTHEAGITEKIERQIFNSVMAFAYTGSPGHAELPEWPASTPEAEYTMVFGRKTQIRVNHDAELMPLLAHNMEAVFAREMAKNSGSIQH